MLQKVIVFFIIAVIGISISSCSFKSETFSNTTAEKANDSTPSSANSPEVASENTNTINAQTSPSDSCDDLKRKGFALDKKQTFAIDFTPFEKACFATFHDPDFTNPALGAQFFVYKNGKEIFNFPEQFNGGNASCWVDAVSFEDVNADQLRDIIVVGKCGAKSDDYNENMVYINTGKDFKVNKDANMEMMDYTKISQIKNYIRDHQESFAK